MSRWLQNLNPEQRQAVETVEGPLLVLAGAGSGKTRVITHRIAHMAEHHRIPPSQILGMTFTNKAAEEMRQRLAAMVGSPAAKEVTLSTFHALGLQILKEEAQRMRRGGRFVIYDTGDQLACLREVCRRMRLDRSLDLNAVLQRISAFKNAFVLPDQTPEPAEDDEYDQAAAILYPAYQEQLEAYAAVDFDDLVCRPCQLMERSAACRERWAQRFRYVLVDEYQDTNAAQLRLLTALAGEHQNLCVVGDDDQSIYGWRGAVIDNILRFERDFPGARVVYLQRNYRSVAPVLELANHVIAHNKKRHPKQLRPVRTGGEPVRLVIARDGDAEAIWVAQHVRDALKSGGYAPGDVAVLYRSNLLSRDIETELRAQGIPYRVLGGTAFYDSKEIKDLLAYLRVCCYPNDEISLRRILNYPPRGIGPRTVTALGTWAEQHDATFREALERAVEILGSDSRTAIAVRRFVDLVERNHKRLRRKGQLAAGSRALVEELDLVHVIQSSRAPQKIIDRRVRQVAALLEGIDRYCARVPKPTLSDYLARTSLVCADEDLDGSGDEQVTLCTLHGAKGLEFRLVILVGVEEGFLPHERTMNPHQTDLISGDIDEERRLLYVGLTRAMDRLVLTRCLERLVRGRPQPRTPSRFLDDVPEDLLGTDDLCAEPSPEQVQSMVAELLAQFGE